MFGLGRRRDWGVNMRTLFSEAGDLRRKLSAETLNDAHLLLKLLR
jgi:hypothetical protein